MSTALGTAPAGAPAAPAGPGGTGGTPAPAAKNAATPAVETEPKPPEPKKGPIRRTYKYEGKDVEVEYRDEAHEDMERQRMYGLSQNYAKSQADRANVQKFLKAVKEGDPAEALKELRGDFDPDKWAEDRLTKKFANEDRRAADPKGYELEQREQTLKQREAAIEAQAKAAEESRATAAAEKWIEQRQGEWGREIRSAMPQYDAEFVKSSVVPRMADLEDMNREGAAEAKRTGGYYEPLTVKQMAEQVRYELQTAGEHHVKSMDVKALMDFLGPEKVDAIRQAHLAAVSAPAPVTETPTKTERAPRQPRTEKETHDGLMYATQNGVHRFRG